MIEAKCHLSMLGLNINSYFFESLYTLRLT